MTFRFPAKNAAAMEGAGRPAAAPPSRVSVFRRLLVRVTPAAAAGDGGGGKEIRDKLDEMSRPPPVGVGEAEVGSAALDRMVLSFMEDAGAAAVERPPRGRCSNCFNGSHHDASDDEDFDFLPSSSSVPAAGDDLDLLKGLVQCASTAERNLLADASRIAERHRGGGRNKKADVRRAVAAGLRALGYDAAVCTSRWEKSATHPAGEHEYIDAVVDNGATRLVVEVDFRSEFEVARPTKAYRAALQALPPLFVGSPDRAGRVAAVVAEAARQSLRKRGLHFPPWRKPEYMRAKWTAPHARAAAADDKSPPLPAPLPTPVSAASFSGEFELRFDDKLAKATNAEEKITVVVSPSPLPWRPVVPEASKEQQSPLPPVGSKGKVVTGLASVL